MPSKPLNPVESAEEFAFFIYREFFDLTISGKEKSLLEKRIEKHDAAIAEAARREEMKRCCLILESGLLAYKSQEKHDAIHVFLAAIRSGKGE